MLNFTKRFLALGAIGAIAMVGCTDDGTAPASTANIEITTAELNLSSVDEACYGITVRNNSDEIVWTQDNICASQYGDGISAISYVGACDADDNNNVVEIVIESLYSGVDDQDDPIDVTGDYQNPCPPENPIAEGGTPASVCLKEVECIENKDVPVDFNFVVMSRAKQGFFDIVVEFDEIFCSAKFDTCYGGEGECFQFEIPFTNGERRDGKIGKREQSQVLWFWDNGTHWVAGEECGGTEAFTFNGRPFIYNELSMTFTAPDGTGNDGEPTWSSGWPVNVEDDEGNKVVTIEEPNYTGNVIYDADAQGDGAAQWLNFLWGVDGDAEGTRLGQTGILAFSCTAGPGKTTQLWMGDFDIECDGESIFTGNASYREFSNYLGANGNIVPPTDGNDPDGFQEGNQMPIGTIGEDLPWQWAWYHQNEQLECGDAPCGKQAFEIAIGLEGLGSDNCVLTATASAGEFTGINFGDDDTLPEGWPVIEWDIPLSVGGKGEGLQCLSAGLGEVGVVHTNYTSDAGGRGNAAPQPGGGT